MGANRPIRLLSGAAAPTLGLALCLSTQTACDLRGVMQAVAQASSPAGDVSAERARQLIVARKFQEAIPLLEQALEEERREYSKTHVLTMLGNCYSELDDFETALKWHDRAIESDPGDHIPYTNKGIALRLIGDYLEARKAYEKSLALEPNYAEAHASLAALDLFEGDYEAAIRGLERSISLDDGVPVAHSNLALAYAMVGRFDDAERSLSTAKTLGYHQPEVIQARIDELRSVEEDAAASRTE